MKYAETIETIESALSDHNIVKMDITSMGYSSGKETEFPFIRETGRYSIVTVQIAIPDPRGRKGYMGVGK